MLKHLTFWILLLLTQPLWAWNKCVINGKIIYQDNGCPAEPKAARQTQPTPIIIKQQAAPVESAPQIAKPEVSRAPVALPEVIPASQDTDTLGDQEEWKDLPLDQLHFSGLKIFLLVIGLLINLIGAIIYIVRAFQTSVLWGISTFIPLVSILFLVVHWNEAKMAFLLQIIGLSLSFYIVLSQIPLINLMTTG